jgi:coenzyme F420-reducing hydrogenase beta subunit
MTRTVLDDVIANDNCIGCGACAFAAPDQFAVALEADGHYRARRTGPAPDGDDALAALCPMSGQGRDEDALAAALYPDLLQDRRIGRYSTTLAGHVVQDGYRAAGGSGGLVTWLAVRLLETGAVGGVLHVRPQVPAQGDDRLFAFALSQTPEEVRDGAKSRYYPVTLAEVLPVLAEDGPPLAVIGTPCFVKTVRMLIAEGKLPEGRVAVTLGLVCGHLKSAHFATYLAWQKDCAPGELTAFDFRHKLPDRPASKYGFSFSGARSSARQVFAMDSVRGGDWGEGQFKNPACDFCDDVLAECADVAVGDAWLPGYVDDAEGTNIVVTRDPRIDALIREGRQSGALAMDEVSVDDVAESQSSGLRHRREGLAHRLAMRAQRGTWAPQKRVAPRRAPNILRRMIYDLRLQIALRSAPTFAEVLAAGGGLPDYERRMAGVLGRYNRLSRGASRFKRLLRRFR